MPSSSRSPTRALKTRQVLLGALQFVDVPKVLEHLRDQGQQLHDRLPSFVGAKHDRASKRDVRIEGCLHRGEVLGFDRFAECDCHAADSSR